MWLRSLYESPDPDEENRSGTQWIRRACQKHRKIPTRRKKPISFGRVATTTTRTNWTENHVTRQKGYSNFLRKAYQGRGFYPAVARRGTKLGYHYQVTRRIRRQLQVNWRRIDVEMAQPPTQVVWRRAVLQKVPGVAMSQRVRPNVPVGCQLCPFRRQLGRHLHPPPGRCPVGLDQSFRLPRRTRRVGRSDSRNRLRNPTPRPLAPAGRCAIG